MTSLRCLTKKDSIIGKGICPIDGESATDTSGVAGYSLQFSNPPLMGLVEKHLRTSSRVVTAFRGRDVAISNHTAATTWRLLRFDVRLAATISARNDSKEGIFSTGPMEGRLVFGDEGQGYCRKETWGDTPVLSLGSGPVADNLESFCRRQVLVVDMIDSSDTMETEGDILSSAEGIRSARGVMETIDEVLGPGNGPEKEHNCCTGAAG